MRRIQPTPRPADHRPHATLTVVALLAVLLSSCGGISSPAAQPSRTTAPPASPTASPSLATPSPPRIIVAKPWRVRVAIPHQPTHQPGTYPWANTTGDRVDDYGMYRRQCTSFAAWYLNSRGTPFGYHTKGPQGVGTFADASTWDTGAAQAGTCPVPRRPQSCFAVGELGRCSATGGSST